MTTLIPTTKIEKLAEIVASTVRDRWYAPALLINIIECLSDGTQTLSFESALNLIDAYLNNDSDSDEEGNDYL